MKAIIIEDEAPSAEKLQKLLQKTDASIQVLAVLGSIAASVHWLQSNPQPDIIFMDIELADGPSFSIFNKAAITCPVIFITAYDEYWQAAFEHNSIDYLLKPLKQEKLQAALNKYNALKQHFAASLQQLMQWQQQPAGTYKKRWLVKRGTEYIAVKTENIAYCYATHKVVCMVDAQNQKYVLDASLAELEKEVNPHEFFRINRQYLVNINAVKKIKAFGKGKLAIELSPATAEEVIINNETTAAFKTWMGQ